ncbi:unnamed protein product [Pelagomonas calceolata]|uniref:HIT-type domain-containing protein n=1 Tax=Pelagomonas calceolata TaxID=35677 RepID=A0A8J2X3N1_9STRA|nr:unnamed protein product [Pelagomonas calceolata]
MSRQLLQHTRHTQYKTTRRDAEPTPATANNACSVCQANAGRYACPRCGATYCSLECFRNHGDRCSEGFFKERVKAALAQEPQKKARWVGDLLKGAPSPEIDEARLLQLLDGSVQPTKAEEQLVLRAIANGELESEPWAPWWCDLGRLDDDLAACASKYDALSSEALRDADAARRLYEAERSAETTEADAPGGEVTRARVLARSSKAPPLWLLVWAPSDAEHAESVARVCRDNLNATAAPAPSVASALYAYCAAARAFDGFHLDEGAAADAWLAACPAVARDERPETVAAALVDAERRAIAAGLASKGGHAALARDAAAILGAGPRAVAAALLDAWACIARHRAAPKRVRRKIRYLACWCGAPVAAKALADAREACLAVRIPEEDAPLPALVDLSLSSSKPSKPVVVKSDCAFRDYDAPD